MGVRGHSGSSRRSLDVLIHDAATSGAAESQNFLEGGLRVGLRNRVLPKGRKLSHHGGESVPREAVRQKHLPRSHEADMQPSCPRIPTPPALDPVLLFLATGYTRELIEAHKSVQVPSFVHPHSLAQRFPSRSRLPFSARASLTPSQTLGSIGCLPEPRVPLSRLSICRSMRSRKIITKMRVFNDTAIQNLTFDLKI
ncbi:hypothetical protein BU26DRAFT_586066 [Trematosphaeria pertusa]|uniref:Uncharacterized protein n=1 Tax=Trematosphaeria pertusa TaxID=390896 RepID=A0A6A6HV86_9PLEO|nr:uncharacterized protein BU26DRAFT_586066 [Trematosphaeria pertusa]KAF2241473.1 hypothetical protein BU26DRAFT_586066 [Trematosphaeria pertusa]